MSKETIEFLDVTCSLFIPLVGVFLCAAVASISDNPSTWLIRATAWLCVIVARYLASDQK